MFCEESLEKIKFRAFLEQVSPWILSLERVDYFGTSKHFSGWKKTNSISKTSIMSVVNFHCMQMSLVMSMQFIFSDDWNDTPCSHHVFLSLAMMSYFSRIEALEFLCNSACVQPVTADVFPAITDTRTKSVQKQIVEYDIKSTVDKLT